MTISGQLDRLRAAVPGCMLAAYGDRKARLILRTSAEQSTGRTGKSGLTGKPGKTGDDWRQEHLDALCSSGAELLAQAERLAERTGRAAMPPRAVVSTGRDIRVFLGASGGGSDVICCVCAPGTDTDAILQQGAGLLGQLSGGAA